MKIFLTKYLAALKIMKTSAVLFPFTSRTASSSNTWNQPRCVRIDLISGNNLSICLRTYNGIMVLQRIEGKPKAEMHLSYKVGMSAICSDSSESQYSSM